MIRLAKAIKLAAEIREESFDSEVVNFYRTSLLTASDEAAEILGLDKTATLPIYLLLQYCWNDILDWADEIDK